MRSFIIVAIIFLFLLLFPPPSHAQWNPDGGLELLNNMVDHCDWWAVPDDEGGFWLAYMLENLPRRCYLQRYDSLGVKLYDGPGYERYGLNLVNPEVFEDFLFIEGMVSDGEGGVILGFMDRHMEGDYPFGLYAQRFNSDGERLWGDEALPVVINRYSEHGLEPNVCSDQNGGVFIAYWGYSEGYPVAIQHVTHDGEVLYDLDYPHGGACDYGGIYPTRDGDGVYTIGYHVQNEDTLVCGKSTLEGEIDWISEVSSPRVHISGRHLPSVVETENHGAWFVYLPDTQPHIVRLNNDGEVVVPAFNMFPSYSNDHPNYSKVICDDDGNAYLVVSDNDGSGDIRINKVRPDGTLPWGGEGVELCNVGPTDAIGRSTELFWDSEQQSIITGFKNTIPLNDTTWWHSIFVQSLNSDGERQWGENGQVVMKTNMSLLLHRGEVLKLSDGSYLVLANGNRNDTKYLFAGKVYSDGSVPGASSVENPEAPVPASEWQIVSSYPNPFNSSVKFTIYAGYGDACLNIYNISGRLVFKKQLNAGKQGNISYEWRTKKELSSGIYFVNVMSGDKITQCRKIVLMK